MVQKIVSPALANFRGVAGLLGYMLTKRNYPLSI